MYRILNNLLQNYIQWQEYYVISCKLKSIFKCVLHIFIKNRLLFVKKYLFYEVFY